MSMHNCIQLLLLGVAFVNASPAWFYNTGSRSADPSAVVGCSSFIREYDPYAGRITYRCNPNIVTNNFLDASSASANGAKDAYTTRTSRAFQSSGRPRSGPQSKAVAYHRFQTYGRSRNNRCPSGQIFQSELNICIDHPIGRPLPPPGRPGSRQHKMLNSFDRMLGDVPFRASSSRQMTQPRWSIISVGKFPIKNRCKPHEILVSELDICLPRNNCYPHSKTC